MKTILRVVSHPISEFAVVFLLMGIQPVSAESRQASNGADASPRPAQVLIVRDYAGYDEIGLPTNAQSGPRSTQPPLSRETLHPWRATSGLLSAAELGRSLDAHGRVEVGGIMFDARDEVHPSSKPALDQIGALLKQRPGLRLHVVGHTDNIGALASNRELSKRRAHAVCVALVMDHGIARSRLTANGMGSLAPVTSNQSDTGRAKNRRVELVAQ